MKSTGVLRRTAAWLAFVAGTGAIVPHGARAETARAGGQYAARQIEAGTARLGLAFNFGDDGAVQLWSCLSDNCLSGAPQLVLPVPEELRKAKPNISVVRGAEESALLIRLGPDNKHYSVLVVGADKTSEGNREPQVILKGWSGPDSKSQTRVSLEKGESDDELILEGAPKVVACGRAAPSETRIFDVDSGRFRRVRMQLLSKDERNGAQPLKATAQAQEPETLLVGLSATSERSAFALVDGDRDKAWAAGYEFVELSAPKGVSLERFALEVSEPLSESNAIYLATSERVYELELPAQEGTFYLVEVPQAEASCVALIQPRTPGPVTEALGLVAVDKRPTTVELVSQLERGDAGWAAPALRVRGGAAALALAAAFPKMSALARGRAFEFTERVSDSVGAPVLVAALVSGNEEENRRAFERLKAMGKPAVALVEAQIKDGDPARRSALISALTNLSHQRAARVLPTLFEDANVDERLQLRHAVSFLARKADGRPVFQELVSRLAAADSELPLSSQVEVARGLGPVLSAWEPATIWVEKLSARAHFASAYRLAPLALALSSRSPKLEAAYRSWMVGKQPDHLSETESAALSARLLDLLAEKNKRGGKYRGEVISLLDSRNMRVRRAALHALTQLGIQGPRGVIEALLKDDEWPEVRAFAAPAAIAAAQEADSSEAVTKLLVRRLRRDDHPTVRRSIARTLSSVSGDAALSGLRRAFEKDESFLVRAEAAVSLGRLCDTDSLPALTRAARRLAGAPTDEGQIELGLSAVTALAYLNPKDLEERLAPLFDDQVSGVTQSHVRTRLEAALASGATEGSGAAQGEKSSPGCGQ